MAGGQGVLTDQIPGLIKNTLAHYKDKPKFQMALEYQRYFLIDEVMDEARLDVQSGRSVEVRLITDDDGQARHALPHEGRTIDIRDNTLVASMPWSFADGVCVWSRFDLEMNKGPAKLLDTLKKSYALGYASLLRVLEQRFPLAPESADDQRNPRGLAYHFGYLPSGTVNYNGGFLGTTARFGDGTSTTNIAGINRVTNPKARNWAGLHDGMTVNTLDSLRRLLWKTEFKTPSDLREFYSDWARKQRIVMSQDYAAEYERLMNQHGPDGRNKDLNPFYGNALTFRGVRVVGIPTLDSVALNPIYVVDLANFQPVVLAGFWLREDDVMRDRNQRHVYSMAIDCWYSYIMHNPRRAGGVLHLPW